MKLSEDESWSSDVKNNKNVRSDKKNNKDVETTENDSNSSNESGSDTDSGSNTGSSSSSNSSSDSNASKKSAGSSKSSSSRTKRSPHSVATSDHDDRYALVLMVDEVLNNYIYHSKSKPGDFSDTNDTSMDFDVHKKRSRKNNTELKEVR